MKEYVVNEYYNDDETPVGEFHTFDEAYTKGFLWCLGNSSEILFDESRGECYNKYDGWFRPDQDDISDCIFLPSELEIRAGINNDAIFEFKLSQECSIVIEKII